MAEVPSESAALDPEVHEAMEAADERKRHLKQTSKASHSKRCERQKLEQAEQASPDTQLSEEVEIILEDDSDRGARSKASWNAEIRAACIRNRSIRIRG